MKLRKNLYFLSIFFLSLSGFGQMPIFKRYYIADIPGLGWLAEFYSTHDMHYITAAIFLALIVFVGVDFMLGQWRKLAVTGSGYVKICFIGILVVTGVLMVIKNLEGVMFSHGLIIALDLVHLGACMGLLLTGLYSVIQGKKWVVER